LLVKTQLSSVTGEPSSRHASARTAHAAGSRYRDPFAPSGRPSSAPRHDEALVAAHHVAGVKRHELGAPEGPKTPLTAVHDRDASEPVTGRLKQRDEHLINDGRLLQRGRPPATTVTFEEPRAFLAVPETQKRIRKVVLARVRGNVSDVAVEDLVQEDPGVHHPAPGVHDGPILAFMMHRS
jgi:hypothetical protein